MKGKFKVGDRVKCVSNGIWGNGIKGRYGIVREIRTVDYGVEFDDFMDGHNLCGNINDTNGWYCGEELLIKADTEMKKYELTTNVKFDIFGRRVFQIRALIDFGLVKIGDLGGWIEKEENLSHDGDAWVYGDAEVCGNAKVYGNAKVCGNAKVYGDAEVCGNAKVYGDADYTYIRGFGSCFRTSTFFRCADGLIRVVCGCFYGTIEEFKSKVKQTHGDSKKAEEYLKIAELMEYHFEVEKSKYNARIVCVSTPYDFFTVGKIYTVIDGALKDDIGGCGHRDFVNIDDVNDHMDTQFVEIKED